MAFEIETTHRFEKSVKRCVRRGLDINALKDVLRLLAEAGKLPAQYKQHKLSGDQTGKWECHIQPDWLLIWEQHDNTMTLLMLDTGTHSDLFK